MVFRVARTGPYDVQSGQVTPGSGAQTNKGVRPRQDQSPTWSATRPTKGKRTAVIDNAYLQSGQARPDDPSQCYPAGTQHNPPLFGGVYMRYTPYYDRGADAYAPQFGKLLSNPIGAGVVARYGPQAYYHQPAQYANGAIWWTTQQIPTSLNLSGLYDPEELADLLNAVQIQAVIRTTG